MNNQNQGRQSAMPVKNFKFNLALLALSALTACGGGSGDSTTGAASTSQTQPEKPAAQPTIVTSVPTPTYLAGGMSKAAYDLLNQERATCGFGLLAQNAKLDAAAAAHAEYLLANNTISHTQSPQLQKFTGVSPMDRAKAQGYDAWYAGDDIAGNVPDGRSAIRGLLAAPYHSASMISAMRDVGISFLQTTTAQTFTSMDVILLGVQSTATNMQLPVREAVLTYPCQDSAGFKPAFSNEYPNWRAGSVDAGAGGHPVIITAPNGEALVITSATISAVGGGVVPTQILTAANDPNKVVGTHQAFVIPPASLAPNTTYRVQIVGTVAGVQFAKDFTATTGS
ncbi:CAP domain-containing protein (plasmid) [Polaromonas sp. P1-6]|nr:CAP domain-containing protein [Polaromonas sp. P1-6]